MPRYCFLCPECGHREEVIRSMSESDGVIFCPLCTDHEDGPEMQRDFQAEGVHVGAGHRSYHRPIVSDSMAISPEQIPEHKKMFPDIKVTSEGQPVFDNYSDHEKYLKKCNIEKVPQKKKKRGRKIA